MRIESLIVYSKILHEYNASNLEKRTLITDGKQQRRNSIGI